MNPFLFTLPENRVESVYSVSGPNTTIISWDVVSLAPGGSESGNYNDGSMQVAKVLDYRLHFDNYQDYKDYFENISPDVYKNNMPEARYNNNGSLDVNMQMYIPDHIYYWNQIINIYNKIRGIQPPPSIDYPGGGVAGGVPG